MLGLRREAGQVTQAPAGTRAGWPAGTAGAQPEGWPPDLEDTRVRQQQPQQSEKKKTVGKDTLRLISTWYDRLLEELLPQVGEEADDALPGDLPQVGESRAGVGAVKDPGRVHDQQHVLQRLGDRLQLHAHARTHNRVNSTRGHRFGTDPEPFGKLSVNRGWRFISCGCRSTPRSLFTMCES